MPAFDPTRLNRIADWMQGYVDARRFAGCSVLIAQGGQEAYYHDCGARDVAQGKPFQRDTVARIYSMSKPITSVGVMMLVERGLFHLDAPLSDFIPAFKEMRCLRQGATSIDQTEPCATPTIHQLMTHTAGMSYPFNTGILSEEMARQEIIFRSEEARLVQMVDRVAGLPLAFHPGSRWEYSIAIDILGRVLEVVSGKDLERFLVDEILGPLEMNDTRFSVPKGAVDRFGELYTPLAGSAFALNAVQGEGETLRRVEGGERDGFLNAKMYSGGGGLVGTIDDYMTFAEALRKGGAGLISPKTLDFMMRNHLAGDIASMGPSSFAEQPMEGMGFGLGGAVLLDPARARVPGSVGDFSWGGMASTFFWIDPLLDLSVVFFTQLSPSSAYPGRAQLKALVHGALL